MRKVYEKPIKVVEAEINGRAASFHFRPAKGLRAAMDDVRAYILKRTGVQVSQNEFILKAIGFYLEYLAASRSQQNLLNRLDRNTVILERPPGSPDEAIENA